MKNLMLSAAFMLLGTFAFASNEVVEITNENTVIESNNVRYTDVSEGAVSVTYCVAAGGGLFCCEAATYGEARDCAKGMAQEALAPQD